MRSGKARPKLNGFLTKLGSWEAVSDRARRFHSVRGKLETEIGQALPVWRLWIDDEIVERYRARVERLEDVAKDLAALIHDVERVESEVSELAKRAPAGESKLASWLFDKCRDWLGQLGRLGTTCERSSDVYRDHSMIGPIESDVRAHEEALQQLREAARVTTALRTNIRAAELIGLLPELHKRLYTEGATADWLTEIKNLVQPLKLIADRVQDPPPELYDVAESLREARGWSKLLGGELADEIQELGERHQFKAADWEGEQIDDLVAGAAALRQRLFDRAQEVRRAKLAEIEEQMDDLRQACGYQKSLQEKLAALQEGTFDHPEGFREWLLSFEQFQLSFKANAHADIGKIDRRLRDAIAELQKTLREIENGPLSDEVNREAALLEYALRQLPEPSEAGAEEMLRGLRKAKAIEREIEQLTHRAEEEYRDLADQQRTLRMKSEAMEAEAQRLKRVAIDLSDLPSRIAALSELEASESLAERRQLVRKLEAELQAMETAFVASCQEALSSQLTRAQQAGDVLRSAGVVAAPVQSIIIASGAQPREAAQAVIEAARRVRLLSRQARESLRDYETRAAQAHTELSRLRPDELTPGDRHTAEHLAQALDVILQPVDALPLLRRLARAAGRVNESDRFFAQLRQEEIRARERLSDLRRRLQELHEEQLDRFCPELTERIAALLYGVPERPRQWSAVHHQLNIAGDLFGRVETHARRLAADEVGRAAETLRKAVRGTIDPSFRASALALLDELDVCGSEELPGVSLRRRIVGASQRRI